MIQLQKPKWIYFGGKIRPWEEGVLHISSEAVYRGLNVFEGLKGYWQVDGVNFGIVAMPRHFARLQRSARLLYIPCPVTYEQLEQACHDLIRSLYQPDRDMWIRAALYVIEGHWGEGTMADLVLTAYHQDTRIPYLEPNMYNWAAKDSAMAVQNTSKSVPRTHGLRMTVPVVMWRSLSCNQ